MKEAMEKGNNVKNVGVSFQIMTLRTCLYKWSGLDYFSHYAGLAAPHNVREGKGKVSLCRRPHGPRGGVEV